MKKLLGVSLACAVTLVCGCFAVACGGDEDDNNTLSDKEKVQEAISSIRMIYMDASEETPGDYEVMGQTKTKSGTYDVSWSVSTEQEGVTLSDYVSVGTMDATTKLVTISVNSGSVAVKYSLTASVTVGEETESVSFTRKTVAVLSVADVYNIGNSLESGSYYTVDGEVAIVAVKGYVVDPGTYETGYKNFNKVYIVDEYSADKTSASEDALLIYRIVRDDVYLTQDGDLNNGDLLTVSGVIQNYDGLIEVNYHSSLGINITCIGLEKAERTDADKVAAAEASVKLEQTIFTETTSIDLPATNNQASLTWEVKSESEYVTIANGKLNIVSVPDEETTVTITVTIKSGDVTATKDFEIKVGTLKLTHAGTAADPFSVEDVNKIFSTLTSGSYYYGTSSTPLEVYIKGYITTVGSLGASYISKMYIADAVDSTDTAYVYRIAWSEAVPNDTPLFVGDQIVLKGWLQNFNGTCEVNYYNNVNPSFVSLTPIAMTAEEQANYVLSAITLPPFAAEDITLPTVPSRFSDITLSFTSSNTDVLPIVDGVLIAPEELPETPVVVTITATVSYGEGDDATTKEQTYNITVGDLTVEGEGTEENPFSVMDLYKLAVQLDNGAYYTDEEGVAKKFYATGYITTVGTIGSFVQNMYIADEGSSSSMVISSINYDPEKVPSGTPLAVGDKIVVEAFLRVNSTSGVYQISSNGSDYAYFRAWEPAPENLLAAVLGSITLPTEAEAEDEITLPTVPAYGEGVTISFTSSNTDAISIDEENGKLVVNTVNENTAVTITITASKDGVEEKQTTRTITVLAPLTEGETKVSLTIAEYAAAQDPKWANATQYLTINVDSVITATASGTNISNTGKYYSTGVGTWRIYYSESGIVTFTAAEGYTISSIKVTYASASTGVMLIDGTQYASDEIVAVNATSCVVGVGNTGNLQISAVEIVYTAN